MQEAREEESTPAVLRVPVPAPGVRAECTLAVPRAGSPAGAQEVQVVLEVRTREGARSRPEDPPGIRYQVRQILAWRADRTRWPWGQSSELGRIRESG